MGVEDSMGTAAAAQLWIAARKGFDRFPSGFERQIVGNSLMSPQ